MDAWLVRIIHQFYDQTSYYSAVPLYESHLDTLLCVFLALAKNIDESTVVVLRCLTSVDADH